MMGNLPRERVEVSHQFLNVRLVFAGPFGIKISRKKNTKAYLCVFVCMATKALHLEIVSDLSTVAILNTLKRFIARRGKAQNIFSDNETNFQGTDNLLQRFIETLKTEDTVHDFLSSQSIRWHFIPP